MLPENPTAELDLGASGIIGRDSEKAALTRLISGSVSALRVVAVWGMGGMGKSSLVRTVHNNDQVHSKLGMDTQKASLFANVASNLCYKCSEYCNVSGVDQFRVKAPEGMEKLRNLHMLGMVNVGRGSGVVGTREAQEAD